MANLTRIDPFHQLIRFDPFMDMDDVINKMWPHSFYREGQRIEPQIRLDVKESENQYTVKAEIPGVKKDDIHVTVDGKMVSITAEIKQEKEEKEGERVLHSERSYGMASRSFSLSEVVDQANVQAKYADGILELILPKKTGTNRKEIAVT